MDFMDELSEKTQNNIFLVGAIAGGFLGICIGFVNAGIGGAVVGVVIGAIVGALGLAMLVNVIPWVLIIGTGAAILAAIVYVLSLLWGVGKP